MPSKHRNRPTDTPNAFTTAPRPGQSGAHEQRRAGPNPRSSHPTGPHAPYEPDDPEGFAAGKHQRNETPDKH
jgi:hypothetical protein